MAAVNAKMRTKLAIFGLSACMVASVFAQPRPATESEIELIREVTMAAIIACRGQLGA